MAKYDAYEVSLQLDALITIQEAAERFAVSPRTVRRWIAEGKVEAYRVGGRLIRLDVHSLYQMREPVHFRGISNT